MRQVAIAGVGFSPMGRGLGLSNLQMTAMSTKAALADAGLEAANIDGVALYQQADAQKNPNQTMSPLGVAGMFGLENVRWVLKAVEGPAYLESAMSAIDAVATGRCEACLTVRTLMHPGSASGTASALKGYGGPAQFAYPFGAVTTGQWAAMMWQRQMAVYGATEEQLGLYVVGAREFALLNDDAQMRKPLTLGDYLESRYISKPLRLYDHEYPISGSGAVIYTTAERARDLKQRPVLVEASALAMGNAPGGKVSRGADFWPEADILRHAATNAGRELWRRTDLRPKDVDVACVYDCYSVVAMNWLEALGFCGEGESGPFVEQGITRPGGSLPVNPDGGSLNFGRVHGISHVIELTRQLRGECGARQTANAEVGVATSAFGFSAGALLLTKG
jgi:acetyl-CoA acetyltransferase